MICFLSILTCACHFFKVRIFKTTLTFEDQLFTKTNLYRILYERVHIRNPKHVIIAKMYVRVIFSKKIN